MINPAKNSQNQSRYIQTSWMLSARAVLELPDIQARIRSLDKREVQDLEEFVRKRNVFSRHSWENKFYLPRIREFSDRTIIEVFRPGNPDDMIDEACNVAELTEKIAVLSSTLAVSKKDLHRQLAISSHRCSIFNLAIGPGFQYLRSKSRAELVVKGITINEQFCKRFNRCGFPTLALLCTSSNVIAKHVISAIDWLFESRQEIMASASVVKTSIALESLLIFDGSEPLARSLSERAAFLLSSDKEIRSKVSRIVREFYKVRSGVVHGNTKKVKKLTPNLIEGMDRLTLLLCLVIASNLDKWDSLGSFREWFEDQRWGSPASDIQVPFAIRYLHNALALCLQSR